MSQITIHWFRQDLRLHDNPALFAAAEQGVVLPIYILDEVNSEHKQMGEASRCWLYYALSELNKSLGNKLLVFSGSPELIILDLIKRYQVTQVNWNRCYEPWRITRDQELKKLLIEHSIKVQSFNGSLLWEPWEIQKTDGTPYRVFTPFYQNGCLKASPPRIPLPPPSQLNIVEVANLEPHPLDKLQLLPNKPWGKILSEQWSISEDSGLDRLRDFIENDLADYKIGRDVPAQNSTSRLSAYLHFGQISPNQAWYAIRSIGNNENIDTFCRELAWREFSYSLLYYNPDLPIKNLQDKFNYFGWRNNEQDLLSWQKGQTGIPLIDAGMRELWQTGYMHNRVRMLVGSFLVKNLLIDWRHGERWFWDCLYDADLASNSASWQWVAGCGADAAPYFRIFNPVTQGQKFDPQGKYIRKYVPELAELPDKYIFAPWEAPAAVLKFAKVELGVNYPLPIVDLKLSRERALNEYQLLKNK